MSTPVVIMVFLFYLIKNSLFNFFTRSTVTNVGEYSPTLSAWSHRANNGTNIKKKTVDYVLVSLYFSLSPSVSVTSCSSSNNAANFPFPRQSSSAFQPHFRANESKSRLNVLLTLFYTKKKAWKNESHLKFRKIDIHQAEKKITETSSQYFLKSE